jgi:hypothetical protein
MTQAEILSIVEEAFPYVPRPPLSEIPFHQDGCAGCEMVLNYLSEHLDQELPATAIVWLRHESSKLSARATCWVLPSYLRQALAHPDQIDDAIEFLIYGLSPPPEYEEETRIRLSLLSATQVRCLMAVVEYWRNDAKWNEYCGEELARASAFLAGVR